MAQDHGEGIAMATCKECDRAIPDVIPSITSELETYCGACHVPFSLEEIRAIFEEFNAKNSNTARDMRRLLFSDLLARVRAHEA